MRIAVLLKQVPAQPAASLKDDFTIDRTQERLITNPSDQHALEMAIAWKKRWGAEVCCLTMGPESAEGCLKEAAVTGADALYHICDAKLAGADTFVTAAALAAGLRHIGHIDLILCGRHSIDGETGQVGPEIAAIMGLPCLGQITEVDFPGVPNVVACRRMTEEATELFHVSTPAVLCVCEGRENLRLPSLSALRRAASVPINRLNAERLGLDIQNARLESPTRVIKTRHVNRRRRNTVWLDDEAAIDTVVRLMEHGRDGDA